MPLLQNQRQDHIFKGIFLIVLSVFCFVTMDSCFKKLSTDYSVYQIIFFRSLFGLLPIMLMVPSRGGISALRVTRKFRMLLCSLTGTGAIACMVTAIGIIPMASVYAIQFSAPIIMTAISVPLLREKVGPMRWLAVLIGFVGVMVTINPSIHILQDSGSLIALAGSTLFALFFTQIRYLSRTHTSIALVFYFTLTMIVSTLLILPFVWVSPTLYDLGFLVAAGLIGGSGQLMNARAYSVAPMAIVSPFEYTHILWGTLSGLIFWHEFPENHVWVGCAIVVSAGLFILYQETRKSIALKKSAIS